MDIVIKYKIKKININYFIMPIKYTFKIYNNNNNYKIFILQFFILHLSIVEEKWQYINK